MNTQTDKSDHTVYLIHWLDNKGHNEGNKKQRRRKNEKKGKYISSLIAARLV